STSAGSATATAEVPSAGDVLPQTAPSASSDPADAGAAPAVASVAAAEGATAGAESEPPPGTGAEAGSATVGEAPSSPEGAYAAARDALEETIAARNLLWTDDRTLDKYRLQSRKDAKKKEFEKATAAATKALTAARAVKVNDKFVKRKLLRYLKRRRELPKGEAKDQAIETENEARKLLKAGDMEEANRMLSDGLRKMYVERESETAGEGGSTSTEGAKTPTGVQNSATASGEDVAPSGSAGSGDGPEETVGEASSAAPVPPAAEKTPAPSQAETPPKAEDTATAP
ncbi:MAG: hypothetical protein ACO3JL_10070, partial [Myxococcota bacterium]